MKRKLLSILLTFCLAFSLLPTAALAEGETANVAKVGETEYTTLQDAIDAAKSGATVTLLADVNTPETSYTIRKSLTIDLNGKTITADGYDSVFAIKGEGNHVVINATNGGKVIAVENSGSDGKYAMAVWLAGEDSTLAINGGEFSQEITHTDDPQMDMIYTSKGVITINGGTFHSGTPKWTLNINDGAYKDGSANIIVNGGTFFDYDPRNAKNEGEGTSLVADGVGINKNENGSFTAVPSMAAQIVDADGNSVAAYATLQEALAAVTADNPLVWVSDSAWSKEKPVYYNGTFYKGTNEAINAKGALECAIDAANTANSDDVAKIYVRPGYNTDKGLVANAHQNIKTSIAIYGNNASLCGIDWEPTVEYPGGDYHTLTKNISIEIYNLHDGAGVWGQRLTNYTVDVTMANCNNVHELMINGQYDSAASSVTNYTVRNCTFDGSGAAAACPVTTTSAGTVVVKDCTFANLNDNYVININNKNGGKTEVEVTGCSFTNCGSSGKEAVRLTGEATSSSIEAKLTGLTFDTTTAANAIIVGNKTAANNNADVTYTITGTNGTLNVYKKGATAPAAETLNNAESYSGSNMAAEVNGTKHATLAAAIEAASNGDTVKLLSNVTENVTIPAGKTITLDLNGFTLVNSAAAQNNAAADRKHTITNNGTLTIKDSVGGGIVDNVSHQCAAIKNNVGGTVTIENGTFCRTAEASVSADVSGDNSYYVIDNQGTMNINGGTFKFSDTKNGAYSSLIHNGWYDGTKNTEKAPAKMTITDGNFTQGTGGKITVKNDDYGELKIQGGTFTQPQAGYYCVFNWNVAEITGGTINGPVGCGGNESIEADKGQLAIGGTAHINGELQKDTSSGEPSISVSGGTFSSAVKPEYCAPGFVPKANSDGTYGVTRPSSGGSSYDPTYSVSTPSKTKNGTVTVSPKNASKGDTVTVTVKPDSGYVLETLTVTDKNGNELTLKDKGNGKYTFTMPAGKVEVKATFMEDNSMLNFFYDVPNNAYFYEAVKWAVENGITTGVGNDLFAPEQPCTRAQIVTFLWRAAGSPEPKAASSFADVAAGSYYAKAVAWAVENGVTTGTGDGKFSPDATCTRAQAVTFLARALSAKASGKAEFSDVPADSYFADAVAWAAANGVTEGIGGGLFGSDNDCTRGQIVTFLYRAYNK